MRRLLAFVVMVFAVGACTQAAAPTPQIIYRDPTPGASAPADTSMPPAESEGPVMTEPPATSGPVGSSRDNPVALGNPANVGDWTIRVTKTAPDSWPAIHKANMFNDAPAQGEQFYMIYIKATYNGEGSAQLDPGFGFRAVGEARQVEYTTFDNSCGVLPDPNLKLDDPKVYTGGSIEGWGACWSIAKEDADSLVAYFHEMMADDSETVWFALR